MSVKISKLWSDNRFISLSTTSKLFYIYLATNPSISTTGVLCLNISVIEAQLKMTTEQLRNASTELIEHKYLHVKKANGQIYFIIPQHFTALPKSESLILRVQKDLDTFPPEIVSFLDSIGINMSFKIGNFVKPTVNEVLDFCMKEGYKINAQVVVDYYEGEAKRRNRTDIWVNSRGKVVKDWKATLRKVWFKQENKLEKCVGAPKGFEYFYVNINGTNYSPEYWKNGIPHSKDFTVSKELRKQYEAHKTIS